MTAQSVILVTFRNHNKYHFVGNVFMPWTDEMRSILTAREKTSYSEGIELNAKFFVFTLEDFEDFLNRTPAEELGWNNDMPWNMDMVPKHSPTTKFENDFRCIMSNGLQKLKEDAKLFNFKRSVFWLAEAGVYRG